MAGCPPKIRELVERFNQNIEQYKSGRYNEAQVRQEFIGPMFKALGWDMDNEQGNAEAYKEVIHEDAIKIGSGTKAPDYAFRIGGQRKFFLEAKKPSIDIKEEIDPAYQIRRYAWSAKLPLSILTDFDEFAVYDCRIKPDKNDKASAARVLFYKYTEYEEKWEEIADIFSKEAILKGSFDRFAESSKKKKGTAEVDDAFLAEIENWRNVLAKNIAIRNPKLSQRELNNAVQTTIDRIIFLRICEDRGIETYGRLLSDKNGAGIYNRLLERFFEADSKYNSGLFHFKKEKGRESPDELTTGIKIDDKVLKNILTSLYYPDCPYEFSVLSADILGQVYEQFLGKVIRLTSGHQAKVEYKPEVKKAGGVFYTPTFIVDYIVQNTVGKLLEGSSPKKASTIKLCDPACGSGSFLLGAYQYLLDWHRDYYVNNGPEKYKKELFKAASGGWRLTIQERKRILLNNIYGVDIDPQAVETTKLSLLLKVLEQETKETLQTNFNFSHERALPDLDSNIKCGNSLIGTDYFEGKMSFLTDDERQSINPFDWYAAFPAVFAGKEPGFDVVIGNPPYVRQELLGNRKDYFESRYKTYNGVADMYVYFIEKAVSMLKGKGLFSYIVSNKWMRANYGEAFRNWLVKKEIVELVDFGDLPVFKEVTTYPCILTTKGNADNATSKSFSAVDVKTLEFPSLSEYVKDNSFMMDKKSLSSNGWHMADKRTHKLLDKIKAAGVPLGEYVEGKIYYGIKTGLNEAFVIDDATRKKLIAEDQKSKELIKPFLRGKDVKRYAVDDTGKYILMIPKGWTNKHLQGKKKPWGWLQDAYPAIANHLSKFQKEAEQRDDQGDYWWELRACEYYPEFEKPKIIVPAIAQRASMFLDEKSFLSNDKTTIIGSADHYLLGILNSKVSDFIMHSISSTKQGGYFEYKPMYLAQIPIYRFAGKNKKESNILNTIRETVQKLTNLISTREKAKTPHDRELIQRQIDAADRQIDKLVYELYDLTEEEITIVEKSAVKS